MPSTSPATSELPVKRLRIRDGLAFPLQHRQRHVLFRRHVCENSRVTWKVRTRPLRTRRTAPRLRDILAVEA